jgi:DNA processing protein
MRLALMATIEPGDEKRYREVAALGVENYFALSQEAQSVNLGAIEAQLRICGGELITPEDASWPHQLNDLTLPPIGLCIKGNTEALIERGFAIVGTRNPTQYGLRNAGDFAAGFADRGYAVVSGGAYGIDSAAHKGALVAEGSGLDSPYPAGNQRLFDEICESGAIVTEYLPGTSAKPFRFLVRNRIIAALADATLVVEAAFRSGSLRTARDAAELFRPVFALPGPITSPTSEGCHRLIGERKAELVTSVADAYELMSGLVKDAILSQ